MSKDLIRLMNALFLPGAEAFQESPWRPNVDVYRTKAGWILKFELAGVRAEDVDLQVLGRRLTLRGVRRDTTLDDAQRDGEVLCVHHRMEINYCAFEREIDLPCDLKKADVRTEFRDGLLLIRVYPEQ